jgi:integrase
MKQESFSVALFPTEKTMWKHLESSISRLNPETTDEVRGPISMKTLITRYRKEVLPELARSTRGTYDSAFKLYIEPKWGDVRLGDVRPMAVDAWLKPLVMAPATKGRLKRLLKVLLDKAMYWEYTPQGLNPIKLVKIKGVSKREKKIILLMPEQVMKLIAALDEPYSIVISISAHLGLRIEETGALQWGDFDFVAMTVEIQRAWTHGEVKEVKTPASEAMLPLPKDLADALKKYRLRTQDTPSKWLFPSSRKSDEKPRWAGIMMQDHIQPVAMQLGLPHLGYHTLRHSYRSWIGSGGATPSEQKDMMRHSSLLQTMAYGGTQVETMRPHVDAVAAKLKLKPRTGAR